MSTMMQPYTQYARSNTTELLYFAAQGRKTERVSTSNIEPGPEPKEREIGPFVVKPLTTDKWLGDAFYRERTGGSGEPQGTIPQD